jgi:methyltransferase (TIGR00027 family)
MKADRFVNLITKWLREPDTAIKLKGVDTDRIPRQTALAAALIRAYHQVADEPRVFDDPLAVRLGGVRPRFLHELTCNEPNAQQLRMFINARSRFADEILAGAVASGCLQVVVLHSGLDTFAYRNTDASVRVFELDDPETLRWKQDRLTAEHIDVPDWVSFVPTDLAHDDIRARLGEAGFDRTRPACFVWLGGAMCVPPEAVRNVLRFIAALPAPPQLVFDYLAYRQCRTAGKAAAGPTVFTADTLQRELQTAGFDEIEQFSGHDLLSQYVAGPIADDAPADRRLVRAARFG